jgi:hypothetical protein
MMQATLAAATQNLREAVRPEFQLAALAFQHLFSNRKSAIRNRRNLNKGKVGFKSNRKKIAIFQMRFAPAARLLDALDQADLVDYANNGCIDRRIWAADSSHRGEAFGGK